MLNRHIGAISATLAHIRFGCDPGIPSIDNLLSGACEMQISAVDIPPRTLHCAEIAVDCSAVNSQCEWQPKDRFLPSESTLCAERSAAKHKHRVGSLKQEIALAFKGALIRAVYICAGCIILIGAGVCFSRLATCKVTFPGYHREYHGTQAGGHSAMHFTQSRFVIKMILSANGFAFFVPKNNFMFLKITENNL